MPTDRLFARIEVVSFEKVSKRYGGRYAVKRLDLRIIGGELLILIGPSGSGKTTALRMVNRLVEPDEGKITINGRDVLDFDPVILRRNIGYVIQQIGLFPHLSVSENVGLVPKLEGWSNDRIEKRVDELLKIVALSPETFVDRYPSELSGGQQQRVGLARALAMNPSLFLMDEPFGALDPLLRKQLQDEFLRIKEDIARTIIFVTHDIEEALRLGDRIAVMRDGELLQIGVPEELITEPADQFVAELVDAERKFKHLPKLTVKDVMSPLSKEKMKDLGDLEERKSFSPNDSLEGALLEMKKRGESIGIVAGPKGPIGVLLADEVLMRLI